jgi:hypothetical protein
MTDWGGRKQQQANNRENKCHIYVKETYGNEFSQEKCLLGEFHCGEKGEPAEFANRE